jgi:hypothetical protein
MCSNKWNEACDIYVNHNCDTSWPNTGAIDAISQRRANAFLQYTPSVGDNLIRNSVERHFFSYPSANVRLVQFDPNVADSPKYRSYSVDSLSPYWELHPHVIRNNLLHDNNPHVKLMLQHPQACFDLLARLYHLQQKGSPQFSNAVNPQIGCSNLTSFFKANAPVLQRYSAQYSAY